MLRDFCGRVLQGAAAAASLVVQHDRKATVAEQDQRQNVVVAECWPAVDAHHSVPIEGDGARDVAPRDHGQTLDHAASLLHRVVLRGTLSQQLVQCESSISDDLN